jgi:hypothetical protein
MNFLKRFIDKLQAFRVAKQAGLAREFAELKKKTRVKAERSTKTPYEPGTLGLSKVSAEIKKDYDGLILSRRDRKSLARFNNEAFVQYYNNY